MNDMLDNTKEGGVNDKSDRPWSSPVVLVRNKNGDLRFCVNYRKFTYVVKKDCFR